MAYLEFGKEKLINLDYSLNREILLANSNGAYLSTTMLFCNIRKYHGLLVCPIELPYDEKHVLLSSLEETILTDKEKISLNTNSYPGNFHPEGFRNIENLVIDRIPVFTYKMNGLILTKEVILSHEEPRLFIRYTLNKLSEPVRLKIKPFLAFRKIHKVTKSNYFASNKYSNVENGIKCKLYEGYPHLFMQFSKNPEYIHTPDWYYNFEYIRERERGYEFNEDLFVPGFFEIALKPGESVIFTASVSELSPASLKRKFNNSLEHQQPNDSFEHCLRNSARQFIIKQEKKISITAGFHWFGVWGRDSLISLPGLTLSCGDVKTCKAALDSISATLNGCLFPNMGDKDNPAYNSVDAPLWYFWAVQQYAKYTQDYVSVWKNYGYRMKKILNGFKTGALFNIHMLDNGLIYAGENGYALTWMDAVIDGKPVTPRTGCPVEINALWFNAISFALELAQKNKDNEFISAWQDYPELIGKSFCDLFWDTERGYLADCINGDIKDFSLKPNQIFALSLPYSPVNETISLSVLKTIELELLTPRGLRTLCDKDPAYKGKCEGNQETRDMAYHQGTVWPWLMGHFAEAYLKTYGKEGIPFIEKIFYGMEEEIFNDGIGTISEIYHGDAPHAAAGTVSQAWSVAEWLRIKSIIQEKMEEVL